MKSVKKFSQDRFSLVWLILGFALLLFSNGFEMVTAAAWVGPIFMLRFLRKSRAFLSLFVGYLVNAVVFYFQWNAAFKDAGTMFTLYTAVFGLLVYLPYVVDRLLSPKFKGFLATLVFPAAWVTMEYFLHAVLPLGTFFNIAYTQNTNLPLLQVMSITGLWGVSFLVIWFSSVVNYVWDNDFNLRKVWKGAVIYTVILTTVLIGGGLRLSLFRPVEKTVQVSVLTTNIDGEPLPDAETPGYARLVAGTLSEGEKQEIKNKMDIINKDLFDRARIQAKAGSKIITFSEFNVQVFAGDEERVLDEAKKIAREEQIYLVFPFEITEPDMSKRVDPNIFQINESVMITPEGKIAYTYVKHNLLIGPELEHTIMGEEKIQYIDTPYGRLASVICLDMEYPDFMRLAAKEGVDIVLSGAIDGTVATKGNPLHSIMASYRTIESGFSLGRAGFYGQNVAVDYQGRIIGAVNHYTAGDRTVTAKIPVKGVTTIYGQLGDFFPWLCIIALIFLTPYSIISARRMKRNLKKETGNEEAKVLS